MVDREIREIINNAYSQAISILNEHKELMEIMANELFDKETLGTDEIFKLILDNCRDDESEIVQNKYKKLLNFALNLERKLEFLNLKH